MGHFVLHGYMIYLYIMKSLKSPWMSHIHLYVNPIGSTYFHPTETTKKKRDLNPRHPKKSHRSLVNPRVWPQKWLPWLQKRLRFWPGLTGPLWSGDLRPPSSCQLSAAQSRPGAFSSGHAGPVGDGKVVENAMKMPWNGDLRWFHQERLGLNCFFMVISCEFGWTKYGDLYFMVIWIQLGWFYEICSWIAW